jgi:hypothetical protein
LSITAVIAPELDKPEFTVSGYSLDKPTMNVLKSTAKPVDSSP